LHHYSGIGWHVIRLHGEHRGAGSPRIFFIFISSEISASDYKKVRRGGADWMSIQGAPQEILDITSRTSRTDFVVTNRFDSC
jgi:hypothetical protein